MSFFECISKCDSYDYQNKSVLFKYPCSDSSSCSSIEIELYRGIYLFEVFGAAGGGAEFLNKNRRGGYGGYSKGFYRISSSKRLFLFIGGQGQTAADSQALGGWNGGGKGALGDKSNSYYGGGGGATDIRLSNDDVSETNDERIIVAGGGGGAGFDYGNSNYDVTGGHGGGLNGEDGGSGLLDIRRGQGANQYVPGLYGFNNDDNTIHADPASLGYGGNALSQLGSSGGGGGGGYYGGGGSFEAGGGGGSGYIGGVMHGYTVSGVNSGNGFIIITQYPQMISVKKISFFSYKVFFFVHILL